MDCGLYTVNSFFSVDVKFLNNNGMCDVYISSSSEPQNTTMPPTFAVRLRESRHHHHQQTQPYTPTNSQLFTGTPISGVFTLHYIAYYFSSEKWQSLYNS